MEKKKTNIVPVAFWILIAFAIYSILALFRVNLYDFNIKNLNSVLKPVVINLELSQNYRPSSFLVCYNDLCKSPYTDDFYNVYTSRLEDNIKVKKIYIAYPKDLKEFREDINLINLNIGNDSYYYKKEDISNFSQKSFSINLDNDKEGKEYSAIELPKADNYKGIFNHISVLFLSLFYNWQIFIIPYFWLFVAFLFFIYNKDKFNFKFRAPWLIVILFAAAFLRFCDITYYPFWTDEVYTKAVAIDSFKSCFLDPGNPPLFFILEFIVSKINLSDFSLRLLPCLFGIGFVFAIYLLLKENSKKEALFGAFLACCNSINIYYSQEARGYSLCAFLSVVIIYFLFKYLKNPETKNLVYYSIFLVLTINLNYYLVLFALTNFIWGVVCLAENKKRISGFILANFISFLTFIPYLIISSKSALSGSFNSWIPALSKETFLYTINYYFINKYVFIILCAVLALNLILCFMPLKIVNKEKENLLVYLVYSITLILIFASAISIFIKPIIHKRVLLSLYGLLFLSEVLVIVSVVELKKLNKVFAALYCLTLTLAYFSITSPMPLRELFNLSSFMQFVKNDSGQYDSNYEIWAVTSDNEEYLKAYPEVLALSNINWRFIDTNSGSVVKSFKKADFASSNNKTTVIYFNSIGVDTDRVVFLNPYAGVYPNNLTTSAKIVYKK